MADGSVTIEIDGNASKFKSEMNDVETEAKDAAGGLDDLDKGADNAGEGLDAAGVAAGAFAAEIANNLLGAIAGAISSIIQLADETREYREDMAKLQTAFSVAGHSTETASKAYEDFYAILGESDRSVEAVNHLAELTQNEEELAKWSDICAGVTAKFGDSLPIEGLTEAANETAKVGKVTGPLADALNWVGISEEEFNKQLAACNSEQERATLITNTLNKEYQAAADEYNELTASAQDNNRATARLTDAQAEMGAALEPLITLWKNFKAGALEAIVPIVQSLGEKFQELTAWMSEHETAAGILKAVIVGLAAALSVLVVWFGALSIIKTVQGAFAALNITMSMNPIMLIVMAIAALVAAFIYLWNNCESFREFWIGLWENIKSIVSAVASWFSEKWDIAISALQSAWSTVQDFFATLWSNIQSGLEPFLAWMGEIWSLAWVSIQSIWDTVGAYFAAIWKTIKGIFSVVKAVLSGDFKGAWDAIKGILAAWVPFFKNLWTSIKNVFSVVSAWFGGIFSSAWEAIKSAWASVTSWFSGIYTGIQNVFSAVASWFGTKFTEAKDAIFNAWNNIVSTFTGYKDKILGVFSGIKSDFLSVGSNIVAGIKSGVANAWNSFVSWIEGKVGGILKSVKKALGIKSPARKFIPVGTMSVKGMEVGFDEEFPNLEKDMESKLSGLTAKANATIAADNVTMARTTGARDTGFSELARAVGNQSAGIFGLSNAYRSGNNKPVIIELNGRELGRAVVDVGGKEEKRVGSRMKVGAAYA